MEPLRDFLIIPLFLEQFEKTFFYLIPVKLKRNLICQSMRIKWLQLKSELSKNTFKNNS